MKRLREYPYDWSGCASIRVIDDTDCACEADDIYAIAHILLTSKFDVRAVTAANFSHKPGSEEESYEAIRKLTDAMELTEHVSVLHGCPPMIDEYAYVTSEASDFIIREAMREDPRPLFVVCQGAVTNLAVALQEKPEIAERITCIWVGGGAYPAGGWEFNLFNDIHAARIVLKSSVELWQIPADVYSSVRVSFMTLYSQLAGCGKAGKHLLDEVLRVNKGICDFRDGRGSNPLDEGFAYMIANRSATAYTGFGCGECWQMGDSAAVGLMLNCQSHDRDLIGAPSLRDDGTYVLCPENERKIYVYRSVDSQFILNDFFGKMNYQYRQL